MEEITSRGAGTGSVVVVQADLTRLKVDAVVNAANEHLVHGGGVAAALAGAGGQAVDEESNRWVDEHGPLGPGQAAVTTAGELPAEMIVHVVGPRYAEGQDNPGLLEQAVRAALDAAEGKGARSVAMPAISAGIFGYPRGDATRVIAQTVVAWLGESDRGVERVLLVGYDRPTADDFAAAVQQ